MADLSIVDSQPLPAAAPLSIVDSQPLPSQGGFWSNLVGNLHPIDAAKKLWQNVTDPHLPTGDLVKNWQAQSQALKDKADASGDAGDYVNFLANMVPGLGQAMSDAQEGIATAKSDEEVRGHLGKLVANVLPLAAANGAPELMAGARVAGPAVVSAAKIGTAAAKAAAPDVAMGALKLGTGAVALRAATEAGLGGDVGGALITAPLIKAGLKQMGKGAKAGFNAGVDAAQQLRDAAARLRVPTQVPDLEPPPDVTPAIAPPAHPLEVAPHPLTTAGGTPRAAPQNEPPLSTFNPYSGAVGTGQLVDAAQRAAAGEATLAVPATETPAAPAAPPGANAVLTDQQAAWLAKRTADTNAKDDTLATWAQGKGITSVAPGQPYADMVAQANKDLGKKYQARIAAPDHPDRVKAFNDLLASKNATAAAVTRASALDKAGVSFSDAAKMTPAQLGVATPLEAANTLFQLQKLKLTSAQPAPVPVPPGN